MSLVACVSPDMNIHLLSLSKSFPTMWTLEVLDAIVHIHVIGQAGLKPEFPLTNCTIIFFLPSMTSDVLQHVIFLGEALSTVTTNKLW